MAYWQLDSPGTPMKDLDWKYKFGSYLHIGSVSSRVNIQNERRRGYKTKPKSNI